MTTPMEDAGYMTVKELAKQLHMSVKTVRGLIRSQRIPATLIGRAYYIHWPTINARLASGDGLTPNWWRE